MPSFARLVNILIVATGAGACGGIDWERLYNREHGQDKHWPRTLEGARGSEFFFFFFCTVL